MKHLWIGIAAVVLAAALVAACAAKPAAEALATPRVPSGDGSGSATPAALKDALDSFAAQSAGRVLAPGENAVYSPLSLYYALAMLSECSYGDTKNEVMQAMGLPCDCDWGAAMQTLYDALTFENDTGRLLLANSIWLSDRVDFKENTLRRLADSYSAYAYQLDMTDGDGAAQTISKWVQEHTKGLLGKDPAAFRPETDELARIINTVYFYDRWQTPFDAEGTAPGAFTTGEGETVTADYMNTAAQTLFAQNSDYSASALQFENGGRMIFVLPGESMTAERLLQSPEKLAAALSFAERETADDSGDTHRGMVYWKVPKFSFGGSMQLVDALKALGIRLAFDPDSADLSALTDTKAYVSSVSQDACIKIDEYGCEAAAFTQMAMCGTSMPAYSVQMELTRPFVFAVTAPTGDLLFLGAVNDPTAAK